MTENVDKLLKQIHILHEQVEDRDKILRDIYRDEDIRGFRYGIELAKDIYLAYIDEDRSLSDKMDVLHDFLSECGLI
jgi:hypothetical protein